MNLDKIKTVGDLHKAIRESNLPPILKTHVSIKKITQGKFAAIDLLREFITENEKSRKK